MIALRHMGSNGHARNVDCGRLMYEGKRVLVTGATGFIGTRLVQRLVELGAHVRVLARNAVKARRLPRVVERCYGNLAENNLTVDLVDRVELIFHLGAATGGDWNEHRRSTVLGTARLVQKAAAARVQRFVHVSSLAAHDVMQGFDGQVLDAAAPLVSGSTQLGNYARGKAEAERVVRTLCTVHALSWTILRPGLVYGPGRVMFEHLGRRIGRTFIGTGRRDLLLPLVSLESVVGALLATGVSPRASDQTYLVVDEDVPRDQYVTLLGQLDLEHWRLIGVPAGPVKGPASALSVTRRVTGIRRLPETSAAKVAARARSVRHDCRRLIADTAWRPESDLRGSLWRSLAPVDQAGRTVRVGLIGAGEIAAQHVAALRRVRGVEITGVLDVSPGKAAMFAQSHGLALAHESRERFYEEARPDVVHILSPPMTHAELAIEAIQRGVHVLCEKPLAHNVAACEAMMQQAQSNGVRVGVNHNCVTDHRIARARAMVASGAIGTLRRVEIAWMFDMQRLHGLNEAAGNGRPWLRSLRGGLLEDLAPHPIAIALAMIGRDARVAYSDVHSLSELDASAAGTNHHMHVLLEGQAVTAHISLTLNRHFDEFVVSLHGTRGTIRIDVQDMLLHYSGQPSGRIRPKALARGVRAARMHGSALAQLGRNAAAVARGRASPGADVAPLIGAYYDALQTGRPLPATIEDGAAVVHVLRTIWPDTPVPTAGQRLASASPELKR